MNPLTHTLMGWALANATALSRKDKALVTLAGVVPDLDGFGILVDLITRGSANPTDWWGEYHHVLGHNLGFGLIVTTLTLMVADRRAMTAVFSFCSFHLHLVGDLIGSRGPDGDQWPIPYLFPFSDAWQLTWQGQWALNAWPNFLITCGLLVLTFYLAWQRGFSPLEIVSKKADVAFVTALRNRLGMLRTTCSRRARSHARLMPGRSAVLMRYRVLVDDNFHYMDESERYELGEFDTLEDAVCACKRIVDEFLISNYRPGMPVAELLTQYAFYGEDPFVYTGDGTVPFSARDYAAERVREICNGT